MKIYTQIRLLFLFFFLVSAYTFNNNKKEEIEYIVIKKQVFNSKNFSSIYITYSAPGRKNHERLSTIEEYNSSPIGQKKTLRLFWEENLHKTILFAISIVLFALMIAINIVYTVNEW